MPAKSRNNNKKRKSGRKRRNNNGITSMAQTLKVVPTPRNIPFRIRRSWTQDIGYYGVNGWFNSGSSDFQINFAASTSNINIGGVAVYGPTTAGSSELSAMFDQYKLMQVTVRIDWNYNSYPVGSGTAVAPLMNYVVDYDDSGSALMNNLLQYPGMKTHSFLQNGYTPLIVSCKPKPLRDIASTGISTAYGPMTAAPWIRTADMTTPHYGLKFCATQFGLGGAALIGNITITCFIDMELANPK
jgi:hypothetical protein